MPRRLSAEMEASSIVSYVSRWINQRDLLDHEKSDRRRLFYQCQKYLQDMGSSTWGEFILSSDLDIVRAAIWLAETIDQVTSVQVERQDMKGNAGG